MSKRRLEFEYCECGCKCYVAASRTTSYSIFWDFHWFHLKVNDRKYKSYKTYKGAKIAANNIERAN